MRRWILLAMLVTTWACGTKRNTNTCCTGEADCQAAGLPLGATCAVSEICRGHECIELTCAASAGCDPTAPYCHGGFCTDVCGDDTGCPGFGQDGLPYCVTGACVECRDGTSDCANGRICEANTCRNCANNEECSTGLCTAAGSCATNEDVAFVHPAGSGTSTCTTVEPCTLFRALSLTPARRFIQFAPGIYQNSGTLEIGGDRVLTGLGADQVSITNLSAGPVFSIAPNADVTIERVKIFGATNGATTGIGIACGGSGQTNLRLFDSLVTGNASHGLVSFCKLEAQGVTLSANGGFGAQLYGELNSYTYSVVRSLVTANEGGGIDASGAGVLRNLFVVRNIGTGLRLINGVNGSPATEFNTIANNAAANCFEVDPAFPKPRIVNSILTDPFDGVFSGLGATCITDGTLRSINGNFNFVSPNAAPFDYHLADNLSIAVDAATGTTAVDFDGDARPKGAAADVGADEAF